jgi:hypothetical protein
MNGFEYGFLCGMGFMFIFSMICDLIENLQDIFRSNCPYCGARYRNFFKLWRKIELFRKWDEL